MVKYRHCSIFEMLDLKCPLPHNLMHPHHLESTSPDDDPLVITSTGMDLSEKKQTYFKSSCHQPVFRATNQDN